MPRGPMGDNEWEMHHSVCRYYGSDPCAWLSEDLPNCPFTQYVPEECEIDCEKCKQLCVCKKQHGQSAYEEYLEIHFIMEEGCDAE